MQGASLAIQFECKSTCIPRPQTPRGPSPVEGKVQLKRCQGFKGKKKEIKRKKKEKEKEGEGRRKKEDGRRKKEEGRREKVEDNQPS